MTKTFPSSLFFSFTAKDSPNNNVQKYLSTTTATTHEPRREKTNLRGFWPGPTNWSVQSQEETRALKFRI